VEGAEQGRRDREAGEERKRGNEAGGPPPRTPRGGSPLAGRARNVWWFQHGVLRMAGPGRAGESGEGIKVR
jgi:hypothetical protein